MRALVVGGGGMRGAYGSGVLHAFAQAGERFDAIYGTSVGGAMGAWFAAGQTDDGMDTWAAVRDREVMSYRRWLTGRGPLIDLELLYGTLYEERYNLDVAAIRSCTFPVYVTATEADTGDRRLFDLRREDVAKALMATSGIPYATEAPFEVDGGLYFDGGLADPLPVQAALDDGATELVIVLNDHVEHRGKDPWILSWHFGRRWPKLGELARRHDNLYFEAQALAQAPPDGVQATLIRPGQGIDLHRFTRDLDRVHEAINMGKQDAQRFLT